MKKIRSLANIVDVILLQTCNRVELYMVSENGEDSAKAAMAYMASNAGAIAASRGSNVFVLVVGRMVNRMIEEVDSIKMKNAAEVIYEAKDGKIA